MNEEQKSQYVPDESKELNPNHKEEITISRETLLAMQEQIKAMSAAFQTQVVHPPVVNPAQATITADSNAAKPKEGEEVVLEEVETSSLFKHNPWSIGSKVRVSKDYVQLQSGLSWRGRVGTIQKILKDPSGVKLLIVEFENVKVPFRRPHPTKPGMTQIGYKLQKATQTFDDSCLEPVYE